MLLWLAATLACQQSAVSPPPTLLRAATQPASAVPAAALPASATAAPLAVTAAPTALPPSQTPSPLPTASLTVTPFRTRTPAPTLPALLPVSSAGPVLLGTPLPALAGKISAENASRLTLLAVWGEGAAAALAWSPDGGLLAVARSNGFGLYDGATLAKLRFQPIPAGVRALVFSPDGRLLAVGCSDGAIELWQVVEGGLARRLEGWEAVTALAFSPDGTMLATAGGNVLQLWDAATGERGAALEGADAPLTALAYSPDGRWLAAGGEDGALALWWVADRERRHTFRDLRQPIERLAFSPDGLWLAAASAAGGLAVWQPEALRLEYTLETSGIAPVALAFSPDGGRLLCACGGELKAWQAADGAALTDIPVGAVFERAGFSPDGSMLASSAAPHTLALWRVADGAPLQTNLAAALGSGPRLPRALTPNGRWLADAEGGAVHLWRVKDGELFSAWQTPAELVQLSASADSSRLVGLGVDRAVYLWHIAGGELMGRVPIPAEVNGISLGPVKDVALSADRKVLAALTDSHVVVLNAASGNLRYTWSPLPDLYPYFEAVAFSPSGYWLAASTQMGEVYLWKASSGVLRTTFQLGAPTPLYNLAFSPDSRLLLAGTGGGIFWQLPDGKAISSEPTPNQGGMPFFVFSPDSRLAAGLESAARGRDVVHLWRADTGEEVYSLALPDVAQVSFSPEGTLLLVQTGDGVIFVLGIPQP